MHIKIGMQLELIHSGIIHEVVDHPSPDKWILASDRGSRTVALTSDIEKLFNIVSTPVVKFHLGKYYRSAGVQTTWRCIDIQPNGDILLHHAGTSNYHTCKNQDAAGWIEVIKSETQTDKNDYLLTPDFKVSSYNGIKTAAIKATQENNMHKPQIGDRYKRLHNGYVYEVADISNRGDGFTLQRGSDSTFRLLAELTNTNHWEYIPAESQTNPTQKEEKQMAAFNFNEVFEQLKSGAKEGTALALDEVVTEMVLSRFKDQMPLLQLPGAKTVALYLVPLGLWAATYLIESDYSSKVRTVTLMAVRAQTSRLIASFGPQLKEIFQEISKLDTE